MTLIGEPPACASVKIIKPIDVRVLEKVVITLDEKDKPLVPEDALKSSLDSGPTKDRPQTHKETKPSFDEEELFFDDEDEIDPDTIDRLDAKETSHHGSVHINGQFVSRKSIVTEVT